MQQDALYKDGNEPLVFVKYWEVDFFEFILCILQIYYIILQIMIAIM
jgi:hypothetical protein